MSKKSEQKPAQKVVEKTADQLLKEALRTGKVVRVELLQGSRSINAGSSEDDRDQPRLF